MSEYSEYEDSLWPMDRVFITTFSGLAYPSEEAVLDRRIAPTTYQPEYIAAVRSESEWLYNPHPSLTQNISEKVGAGELKCPICHGSGRYHTTLRGKTTGVVLGDWSDCPCGALKHYHRHMQANVPERFRGVRLETIVPSSVSRLPLAKAQAILDRLRKYPEKSYLFWGEAATSKTHFMTGLYSDRVWHWCQQPRGGIDFPVIRVQTATLLEEILAWSFDRSKAPRPTTTAARIADIGRLGQKPSLFLDEIDKFNPTEARKDRLLEVINAVYEANGQVVATSNKDPETLGESWGAFHGEALLRRIGAAPDGGTIAFLSGDAA